MAKKLDDQRASLFDLPPELRNRIYSFALVRFDEPVEVGVVIHIDGYLNRSVRVEASCPDFEPNMLLSCKAVHSEATPVLYGGNNFSFSGGSLIGFILKINGSKDFLRHVKLYGCEHQSLLAKSFQILKQVKQLQELTLSPSCDTNFKKPETMAKALGPLIRALHKSRKGTEEKSAMDMLVFAEYNDATIDDNLKAEWQSFETRTRAILQGTLK